MHEILLAQRNVVVAVPKGYVPNEKSGLDSIFYCKKGTYVIIPSEPPSLSY
jgi:hypothetical protein